MSNVPESGYDQGFTPMPVICTLWRPYGVTEHGGGQCEGRIVKDQRGFHICERCGASYGRGMSKPHWAEIAIHRFVNWKRLALVRVAEEWKNGECGSGKLDATAVAYIEALRMESDHWNPMVTAPDTRADTTA